MALYVVSQIVTRSAAQQQDRVSLVGWSDPFPSQSQLVLGGAGP